MKAILRWVGAAMLVLSLAAPVAAQEIRYSWFEIAYMAQDVGRDGTMTDIVLGQSVSVSTTDGDGIRFRGSIGTWKNLYAFVDYGATEIDVDALVSNSQGDFSASDVFDFTSIRGGAGLRIPIGDRVDLYGEATYDRTDLDFGSFAGESFDTRDNALGGALGARIAVGDRLTLRAYGRYSAVGDVDLTTGQFDNDTLLGAGFGITLIRGLSISGDYESGEFSNWSIGFRLDLDED